jgi:hypothetical protein
VRYSIKYRSRAMNPADFRRIALSLEGAEEVSHAGLPAFRVAGRRFASLASQGDGYGNLALTLEDQAAFVDEAPDVLTGALRTAWKLRIEKNAKTRQPKRGLTARGEAVNKTGGRR